MSPHIKPFLDSVRLQSELVLNRLSEVRGIENYYRRMRSLKPWAQRLLADRDIAKRVGR